MPSIIGAVVDKYVFLKSQPTLTYSISTGGKIDNEEAIRQAIYHILMTERYSNPIYDHDYGIELNQYIGKDINYIRASIERTLREALLQDDRIQNVVVNRVEKSDVEVNSYIIEFTVYTSYGNFEEILNVLQ